MNCIHVYFLHITDLMDTLGIMILFFFLMMPPLSPMFSFDLGSHNNGKGHENYYLWSQCMSHLK